MISVIYEPAELKQSCDINSGPIFETQPIAQFGRQHPLGYCDLRSCRKSDDENRRLHPSQMANNFHLNAVERVAGITDFCRVQIMSSTAMPYGIALRRICWKQVPTCAPSSFCSATVIWKRPPSICSCPAAISKR
jgi:hypothetical protein